MSVESISATAAAAIDPVRLDPSRIDPSRIDPSRLKIATSIKQASSTTGASFEYLLTTAKMESNFNPKAAATTSSARGLYQFIDQTWLGTVKEAGAQLGYGKYADAISKSSSGTYYINDPSMRSSIMKLRDDPDAASSMAAVLTQSNSFKLTGKIGRRPNDSELYMAHFMGVGGAAKLISNAEDNPNASAARLFPNAAAANRSIFYEKGTGRARSVSEVYSVLATRYTAAANARDTRTAFAALGGTPRPTAVASATAPSATAAATMDSANFVSLIPDSRAVTPVKATSGTELKTASLPQQEPMFRTLFQAGDRPQPISPAVQELWGNPAPRVNVASAGSQVPEVRAPGRLDLFSDRDGTYSG
ncbi:transglycosylase SLT domain-containing protein [Bradyrhizobium sp.]|uniref:transglycosylase SLT domain-containing protein n=1 Tax=Bradyrhizobium sp. TaxID=376 RepID=UPI001DC18DEC|nr:transglycosylase SLT domain-containing protein [Bradyrhizobium sp.]MBI5318468.1 transglycosylase SLT domain-containing protein [Bradyrhizobium sp.]